MEVNRKVQIKIPHYECDVCGKNVKNQKICLICGRDLCPSCRYDDYSFGGDYPDIYCKHCWIIGEPYRKQIELVENEAELKTEQETKAWHNLCKKNLSALYS